MVKEIVVSLIRDLKEESQKNWLATFVVAVLLVGAMGMGVMKLYRSQAITKEQQAQVAFSHALDEYHHLVYSTAGQDDSRWEDITTSFRAIVERFPNTVYGNFAQVYVADIALHKGSLEESVTLLEEWISKNSQSNPLYYLYKTRLALVYCDINKTEQGIALLQELVNSDKNKQKDMAQFFLGYYYWSVDNIAQAQEVWQPLIDSNKLQSPEGLSPWASIAESKLRYIPTSK